MKWMESSEQALEFFELLVFQVDLFDLLEGLAYLFFLLFRFHIVLEQFEVEVELKNIANLLLSFNHVGA